jgi:hypothetical protein
VEQERGGTQIWAHFSSPIFLYGFFSRFIYYFIALALKVQLFLSLSLSFSLS